VYGTSGMSLYFQITMPLPLYGAERSMFERQHENNSKLECIYREFPTKARTQVQ